MKPLHRIKGAASAAMKVLVQTSLLAGVALVTGIASGEAMEKKGTTPYVTHFVFRPLQNINIEGVGSVTLLEATGTTDNMKGENARQDGGTLRSAKRRFWFQEIYRRRLRTRRRRWRQDLSTFDTRDVDKSQPDMACGTHVITGGTGKYKGISGSEPFACNSLPALAGEGGYTSMDIPHNTTWEIKGQ